MKTPTVEDLKAWARDNASIARTVLLATAHATVMREKVGAIQRGILAEMPLINDMEHSHKGELITDPALVYLCNDKAACTAYDAECDRRERAAGVKPDDMPTEHCPALVAEDMQRQAERSILASSGELFGIDADCLYLEKRKQWLGLVLGVCVKYMKDNRIAA